MAGATDGVELLRAFRYDRGIAEVCVGEPPVRVVFDQLHTERRTAEVGAEVLFYTGTNGSSRLLHRTRLNLTSTRAREEAAKHLVRRLSGIDWPLFLEQAAWRVVDAHRHGPVPILLRDAAAPAGAAALLPPLLLAMDPVVIFGDGGTAKSYLALALGASVHTGRPLVGGMQPAATLRVAFLDFEWNPWPHKKRLRALWGEGVLPDLLYVPCRGEPLSYQVDRLRRIFHDHQIKYAVIDSVALACDGPPEDAEVALRFFEALAQLEVGALLIAHINRGGDTDRPFGSVYWHNSPRATWYVERVQEADSDQLDLALHNRKSNDDKRAGSLGLHFSFNGERTAVVRTDISSVPEFAERLTVKERICHLLQDGAMTYIELAERLHLDVDVVRVTVRRHQGRAFTILTDHPDRVHRVGLRSART